MGRRTRVDLKEAAEMLGSTTEAIRKRAKRGTLDSETGEDGRMYVWVDANDDRVDDPDGRVDDRVDTGRDAKRDELVERMASEIDFLRGELQRKDAILLSMTEGLKSLEAPSETRRSDISASEDEGKGERPTRRSALGGAGSSTRGEHAFARQSASHNTPLGGLVRYSVRVISASLRSRSLRRRSS